jgi:hypothetical protein
MSLKAGILEPEETSTATHRLGKEVSAATDTQATIENLLETVFSIWSLQSGYKEEFSFESAVKPCGGVSNTYTVALES